MKCKGVCNYNIRVNVYHPSTHLYAMKFQIWKPVVQSTCSIIVKHRSYMLHDGKVKHCTIMSTYSMVVYDNLAAVMWPSEQMRL